MVLNLSHSQPKAMWVSLLVVGLALTVGNFFGTEVPATISNVLYMILPLAPVILSAFLVKRFGTIGVHAKAWIMFFVFAILWYTAEQLWLSYDLVYHIDPFPSQADYLSIAGYVFLFMFGMNYIKPVKKGISKKTKLVSLLICIALSIPTINMVITQEKNFNPFDLFVATSYPVADAAVMYPAIIGLALFFRGQVSFLWSTMCLAIVLGVIANTAFLFLSLDNSYYAGHPIDILYLCSYILFSFGVYSHVRIFKDRMDPRKFENPDELK